MICRVCLLNVKKNAVLCEQCSLISHSKCAVNAPPTCDLRAQLLLYAQYAEKGNPGSAYSNPLDLLNEVHPKSPMSDVSYVAHTPRTSLDTVQPPQPLPSAAASQPPTSFKFMAALKRSRSPQSQTNSSTSLPPEPIKAKVLVRKSKDRPQSLGSTSTNPNSSSLRTTITDANSAVEDALTPRPPKATSATSEADDGDAAESVRWHMPGDISANHHARHKKSKSSNCTLQ